MFGLSGIPLANQPRTHAGGSIFYRSLTPNPRQNIWKIPFFNSGQNLSAATIDQELRRLGTEVSELPLNLFQSPDPPVIGLCRVPVFCGISQPESWPCCNGRPFRNIIKSAIPLFLAAEIQTRSRDAGSLSSPSSGAYMAKRPARDTV